jgi:hypothetical protein
MQTVGELGGVFLPPPPPRIHRDVSRSRLIARVAESSVSSEFRIEILKNRKKISTGELSVIVFAKKRRQAVLTDYSNDQDHGAALIPVVADLQKVAPLAVFQRSHGKVVQYDHIDSRQLQQNSSDAAVHVCHR